MCQPLNSHAQCIAQQTEIQGRQQHEHWQNITYSKACAASSSLRFRFPPTESEPVSSVCSSPLSTSSPAEWNVETAFSAPMIITNSWCDEDHFCQQKKFFPTSHEMCCLWYQFGGRSNRPALSSRGFQKNQGTCFTFCMTAMKNPPVFWWCGKTRMLQKPKTWHLRDRMAFNFHTLWSTNKEQHDVQKLVPTNRILLKKMFTICPVLGP